MTTSIIGIMLGGRKNSRQHDWENMTFVPQDDKGLMMNFLYDEAPKGHVCVGGATVKNSPPASLAAFIAPHCHYGMLTKPSIAHKHEGLFSNFIYLEKFFFFM